MCFDLDVMRAITRLLIEPTLLPSQALESPLLVDRIPYYTHRQLLAPASNTLACLVGQIRRMKVRASGRHSGLNVGSCRGKRKPHTHAYYNER